MVKEFLAQIGVQQQFQWKGGNPDGDDDGDGTRNKRDTDWKDNKAYRHFLKGEEQSPTGENETKSHRKYNPASKESETSIQSEILIDAVEIIVGANYKTTQKEIELLEKLDGVLDKVDVVASPDEGKFRFAQDTGYTFTMSMGLKTTASNDPTQGSEQEAILQTAYEQYTQDKKLTKKEIEMIEKIDDILPNADITINPNSGDATIVNTLGSYNIPFPKSNSPKGK